MWALDLVRCARYPLPKPRPPSSTGIRMVAMMKARVRMRSRYSRLLISQVLRRGLGIDVFSYSLDEDLFEGGLGDFKAGDAGAVGDGVVEDELGVG